ncbi:MAG: substrate-binding domain-containing protein, partial [Brevinematales bacterium]
MSKGRLTLGYLSETSFEATTMQMLQGVLKAADERDINLVYFTLEHEQRERTYQHQLDYIYNILERVPVDGFLFLGWFLHILKDEKGFLNRIRGIKKMPIVSMGRKIEGVPSVVIDSDRQLNDLLGHLHDFHGYKKIAFIQPFTPDDRYNCYISFMKSRGIFNPELVVRAEECFIEKDYYDFNRAKRAVDILFDERKANPDAIVSMYSYEASHIINNLSDRGFKVPEDVAIASWEDNDVGKYAKTPITSVYYPFFEIGYEGCRKTIDLIENRASQGDSIVQARMNIRNSCGCRTLDELKLYETGVHPAGIPVPEEDLSDKYLKLKDKNPLNLPLRTLSGEELLLIMRMDENKFLEKLEDYILRILFKNDYNVYIRAINIIHEIQKEILWFYAFTGANTSDQLLKSRAERMVLKVLLILQQKTEEILIYNEELKSGSSDTIQDASQNIITTYDIKKVNNTLLENMGKIGVENYFLFFNLHSRADIRIKSRGIAYNIRNGISHTLKKLPDDFRSILLPDNKRHVYYFHILHINNKLLGFIFFEPGQADDRIYYSFSIQLASALYGSMTLDSLKTANDEIAENLKIIRGKTKELEDSNIKLA